jgi:hypothetical protein
MGDRADATSSNNQNKQHTSIVEKNLTDSAMEGFMEADDDPAPLHFGSLHLLVGSCHCSLQCHVGGVVNCAAEVANLPLGVDTLRLEWREVRGELLVDVESVVLDFVRKHSPFGPVLIHCAAGKVV